MLRLYDEQAPLSKFLMEHRGEAHPLIFDRDESLVYGYSALNVETGLVDCHLCCESHAVGPCPTAPQPQPSSLDALPLEDHDLVVPQPRRDS